MTKEYKSQKPTAPPSRLSTRFKTLSLSVALLLGAPMLPFAANAAGEFPSCDGTVYLTQGQLSRTYAYDLQSGDYKVAASYHSNQTQPPYAWTDKASLNALGFNPNDGFVYGWSHFHNKPVRVHSDWSVEPLQIDRDTRNVRFYIGDVSATHPEYLQMELLFSNKQLYLDIHDFAVHPSNGMIYAIESNGSVVEIDPNVGSKKTLGNDGEGHLYVVRNYDGKIFRVAIDAGNYLGEQVGVAPSSNTQDGFRCASASFSGVTQAESDFGDAPDSYRTSLESDGARHLLSDASGLRLGAAVDAEADAYAFPLEDSNEGADEDGAECLD